MVVQLDRRDSLLVWGGLHQAAPTARLELCDLETHVWRAGRAQGREPAPRFGHTCVPLRADEWRPPACAEGRERADLSGAVDRLIFTGGSNGSDLVRNGIEFREVSYFVNPVHRLPGYVFIVLISQLFFSIRFTY